MVTQTMLRTQKRKIGPFGEKIRLAHEMIKCFKPIKQRRLLLTCAPISELPSNSSTTEDMDPDSKKYYF